VNGVSLKNKTYSSDYYDGEFIDHYAPGHITAVARKLRKKSTESEKILWDALRNRQLGGLKFLRQHPFDRSVVDFYCHKKRLAVEIDGGIHCNRDVQEYDKMRQELIELPNVKFFRCSSEQVVKGMSKVLKGILVMAND